MSELAYNTNGEPFDVPEAVTGWRVRRLRGGRGAPELVYGRDGRPLTLGIEAGMDELRDAVDVSGKYRLDGIDDDGRPVDGVPAAYVQIAVPERSVAQTETPAPAALTSVDHALREVVRANLELSRFNTELAKTIIAQQPDIMNATAEIMRAADGAGMPARVPRLIEVDEDDDAAPAPVAAAAASSPMFEMLNTLVAQVVPMVVTSLMGKKVPDLGAILDWRKAAAAGAVKREAIGESEAIASRAVATAIPAEPDPAKPVELPPVDPAAMAHFLAIQAQLPPDEAALARAMAAELSAAEMRAWFAELSDLSVSEAVAKIRAFVAAQPKLATPSAA